MPMQEGKANMDKEKVIDPMGIGLDGLAASTTGAAAAQRANISQQVRAGNAQLNNPARLNVQRLEREDARTGSNPFIYNPLVNVVDAEIELMAKQIARGNLGGGRAPGAMQPEPMQEELARKLDPSASSFFKPKSGRNNYLQLVAPPVDADGNREVTPEEAARSAALSAEIDASVRADRVRAQLQDQDKVVTDTRNPLEYAKDSTYDELDQRAAAIKRRRGQGLPVYSPDSAYEQDQNSAKAVVAGLQEENINHPIGLPLITFTNSVKKGFPNASVEERGKMVDDMMKAWNNRNKSKGDKPKSKSAPMQENTNRSMFLTHLQGMQIKSQDAQNPGLWVNGNRMPMHENTPGGGTPAGASPEEFAKARAANPFRVRLGRGRPAGAQDLNGDGQVSKAEQELIPVDLRDGDPSANHPDDTDLDDHIKRYGLDN
tara:strand:+ start:5879 stop:7171 length:1293 start_codon:yes stop_codon:yes gene_type:complete